MLNACQDNPSQSTCPFCRTKPSGINDPDADFTPINDEVFAEACLSILHFTINMFSHFCKVGAKIKANVRQHPAVGPRKQAKIKAALDRIKDQFDQLGLQMKLKRMADGNMARVAFENLEFFSEVTGISIGLLQRFNVIRIALASTLKKVFEYFVILSNFCTVFENHLKGLILQLWLLCKQKH